MKQQWTSPTAVRFGGEDEIAVDLTNALKVRQHNARKMYGPTLLCRRLPGELYIKSAPPCFTLELIQTTSAITPR